MTRTIIPKDCCVCDFCNNQVSDGDFKAITDAVWFKGWLCCNECNDQYGYDKSDEMQIIMRIHKGDDLSKTELADPMVLEFGD